MVRLSDPWLAWFVREAAKGRETPQAWAPQKGVTVRWLQILLQRYRETGKVPTLNPHRRPKGGPLLWDQEAAIVQEHRAHPVGATELWHRLQQKGVSIPHQKVHRFYRQRAWTTPNPRKQRPRNRCRYEREHSGSLVHGDYHRTSEHHPYAILWEDDASRKILGGNEFPQETAEHAIETFDEARATAAAWGLPLRQVNTDRGTPFYLNEHPDRITGLGRFEQHLERLGIQHVPSRVKNPQTNGKLERIWAEYDKHRWRFATLAEYIAWTNDRPHSAHAYATPNQAFQRKLPPEVLLGLHQRLVENRRNPVTAEALYAN
jgi:putative transposase